MKRAAALVLVGPIVDYPVPAVRATLLGMVPRVTRLLDWEGDLPDQGEYLESKTGRLYVVIQVKPNTRPNARSIAKIDMLLLEPDDVIDHSRRRHPFRWVGARKR